MKVIRSFLKSVFKYKIKFQKTGILLSDGYFWNDISIGSNAKFFKTNILHFRKMPNGTSIDNQVKIGKNFQAKKLTVVFEGRNNQLVIGDNVKWSGLILIVGQNRKVVIGDNSTAMGVRLLSRDCDVLIGSNCMFSREIEIRSTDVHKIYDLESGERLNLANKVLEISDHVWIGARALISKNVTIPKGSVIGAGSFVNKRFDQENTVIAGVPAKVVRENIRWER